MDDRRTAFEKHWNSQWVDFDDDDTTDRRRRIARDAFIAGWSAAITDEVQDNIRSTARADALREAADRAVCRMIDAGMVSCTRQASLLRSAILSDKQEPK